MGVQIMESFHLVIQLISIIYLYKTTFALKDNIIVNTNSGLVKGKLNEFQGFQYYSFQGIPYAESTKGESRFKPPVPKKPWSYILDATQKGPVCPQVEFRYKRSDMNEDCLHLNIYAPSNRTKLLPAFVNIHGGGYHMLSGNADFMYGPQYLLQRNIVYVSMNNRLHALGFLSLNTKDACGNSGLKDIILSLKWIKENLKYFGGDTNKITIGGNSSGGTMAHILTLSNIANGLFQQVIILSGNAFSFKSIARHPENIAFTFGKELGIEANDSSTLLKLLKKTDVFDITDAFQRIYEANENNLSPYYGFIPSIDKMCEEPSVTDEPDKLLQIQLLNGTSQVPTLVGYTSNEGAYLTTSNNLNKFHTFKELEILIPLDIQYPAGSKEAKELAQAIAYFYFGKNNIWDGKDFCLMYFVDFLSDIHYNIYSTDVWIRKYKDRSDKPLYFYEFNFEGMFNWAKIAYGLNIIGVAHADDIGYIFHTQFTNKLQDSADERSKKMQDTVIGFLTNFVKYGNPTPIHKKHEPVWLEYGKERNVFLMNDNSRVIRRGLLSRTAKFNFWDQVYQDYSDYIKRGSTLIRKTEA